MVPFDRPEGWEGASVISYEYYTSHIANSNGMQISLVSYSGDSIWINYYSPNGTTVAIAGSVRVTLKR